MRIDEPEQGKKQEEDEKNENKPLLNANEVEKSNKGIEDIIGEVN